MNEYYHIYWGTNREQGTSLLYLDNMNLDMAMRMMSPESEAKLSRLSASYSDGIKKKPTTLSLDEKTGAWPEGMEPYMEYRKIKLFKKLFQKKGMEVHNFTMIKWDTLVFTWRKECELLVEMPGHLSHDLVVAYLLKRLERTRIFVSLCCNKNALLTIDGGRIYQAKPMNAKEFDAYRDDETRRGSGLSSLNDTKK